MKAKIYSNTFFAIRKPTKQDSVLHVKGDKWVDWSSYKVYVLKSNKKIGLYWREEEEYAR